MTTTADTICTECGIDVEYYWKRELWPDDAPREERRVVCYDCRRKLNTAEIAARSVPCIICGEPTDPQGNRIWVDKDTSIPVHWECEKAYLHRAPWKAVVEHRWRNVNWKTQELMFVLECNHWFSATKQGTKRMRCRWCAIEALAEKAKKQ